MTRNDANDAKRISQGCEVQRAEEGYHNGRGNGHLPGLAVSRSGFQRVHRPSLPTARLVTPTVALKRCLQIDEETLRSNFAESRSSLQRPA
jgi:hypothetical protein